MIFEDLNHSKVWLTGCPGKTVKDRKEPTGYIHLNEVGDVSSRKNKFCVLMYGGNALLVFKPRQKVELSFHISKRNARKYSHVVCEEKISLVEESKDGHLK